MRPQQLTTAKGGINRERFKGGATPEVLYDLLNGYVNQAGVPVSRPGAVEEIELPASTKGLCAHEGQLVSFTHDPDDTTTGNANYRIEVLVDPTDATSPIERIHFAKPVLGYIYAVAEFETGNIYHYWLQPGTEWTANTGFRVGDVVVPTSGNETGFAYRAHRLGNPNPVWAAGVARTVGDIIEPTVANGFKYECTSTVGDAPRSGTTEPTWPEEDGATVVESTDLATESTTPTTGGTTPGGDEGDGSQPVPDDIGSRYRRDVDVSWREL